MDESAIKKLNDLGWKIWKIEWPEENFPVQYNYKAEKVLPEYCYKEFWYKTQWTEENFKIYCHKEYNVEIDNYARIISINKSISDNGENASQRIRLESNTPFYNYIDTKNGEFQAFIDRTKEIDEDKSIEKELREKNKDRLDEYKRLKDKYK